VSASPPGRRRTLAPSGRAASSFTWVLGVACVLALAYITVNSLRTEGPGSRGVPVGAVLPPFAAPLATGTLEGDANVARRAGEGGARPACRVRGPQILNSCQLAERGPVVLAFFATLDERCQDQVDQLERLRPRFPGVQFAAVSIRGGRDRTREVVRKRGWALPVAHDADGAVANAYAVAVCPTLTFAEVGGRVAGTSLGLLAGAALEARVRRIVSRSRARGWRPPR